MSTKSDRNMLPLEVKKYHTDDRILEEPDNVEEVLLQSAMEELMMESEIESSTEDSEPEIMVQVPEETQKNQQKKTKQKQITDFFPSQK